MSSVRFAALWDELLSDGIVAITARELAQRAGTSVDSVYVAVHHAKASNKLFSPSPGLYVLVPPEYRRWGGVPADWFIDDLMRYLGYGYYVSLLSAAAAHGASHQAAQVFQVMTDHRVRDRDINGVRLRFYLCSDLTNRATSRRTGPTGMVTVATPETCVLDMAERPDAAGGINTIVELLPDLEIDGAALVRAATGRPLAVARRCGWLLEQSGAPTDLDGLRRLVGTGRANPTLLVPGGERRGGTDHTWNVVVNTQLGDAR